MSERSAGRLIYLLVRKDWQLIQGPLLGYALISIVSLALLLLDNEILFVAASIVPLTIVVIVGAHLVMVTVVKERQQQTLPFVMSLPITPMQYTLAKLTTNLGLFAVAWLSTGAAATALILASERLPDGLLPYGTIVLLELLLMFVLTLSVAMVTGSEAWTTIMMTIGNVSISIFMLSTAQIPEIRAHMDGPTPVWNATALLIIAVEVLVAAAAIATTLFVQANRRDFV